MKMINETTYTSTVREAKRPQCVVFDLDATLCNHGSQESFDQAAVFEPIAPVLELAKMVKSHGYDIVIATARSSDCQSRTIEWLERHLPEWNALYMKNENSSCVINCFWLKF